jgi:hypothetical protein
VTEQGDNWAVWLTRIEGKMDLSNLRHDKTEERLVSFDQRLSSHGTRIGNIEAREHHREGERQGVGLSVKVVQFLFGAGVMGALAAFLRALGI